MAGWLGVSRLGFKPGTRTLTLPLAAACLRACVLVCVRSFVRSIICVCTACRTGWGRGEQGRGRWAEDMGRAGGGHQTEQGRIAERASPAWAASLVLVWLIGTLQKADASLVAGPAPQE